MQIDLAKYSSSQLSNYLANVTSINENDLESLEALSEQFPYCQIVQALTAKAALSTTSSEDKLQIAAINAPSRKVLFNLIHHPEKFENKIDEDFDEATGNGLSGSELSSTETINAIGNGLSGDEPSTVEAIDEPQIILIAETEAGRTQPESSLPESPLPTAHIHIETYDHHDSVLIKEIEEEAILAIHNQGSELHNESSPKPEARSHFITTESLQPGAHSTQPEIGSPQSSSDPTLYNDNTLPFSFLWWLNKTRKEHYENNQPYASPQPAARSPLSNVAHSQQLNHQISESVLQHSVLDAYKNDELPSQPVTKEDRIIKKFITQEPQIKHLHADKIDTENKAKKSSADTGELVSETLAKIYVEQMLYTKALDTYKKLSLKYPEKSTYFASQIKYLELKVN